MALISHQVMEAVERFTDPLSAAKHIVQDAFRTWLRYEVRTDDITIIVMFIEDFQEGDLLEVRPTAPRRHRAACNVPSSRLGERV